MYMVHAQLLIMCGRASGGFAASTCSHPRMSNALPDSFPSARTVCRCSFLSDKANMHWSFAWPKHGTCEKQIFSTGADPIIFFYFVDVAMDPSKGAFLSFLCFFRGCSRIFFVSPFVWPLVCSGSPMLSARTLAYSVRLRAYFELKSIMCSW